MPSPVDPADVRHQLVRHRTRAAAPGAALAPGAPVPPGSSPPPMPPAERDAILAGISSSYFRLRRGLAFTTFAFPVVLWLASGRHPLQGSISAYYHYVSTGTAFGAGASRDIFVGVLAIIGSFLFFYRGYSNAEDRALNLAGIAAVVIALSPMDWPPGSPVSLHGRLHGGAAVVFFLSIAYVAIWRSNDTLALLPEAARRDFRRLYRLLGILMVAAPLSVAAIHFLAPRPNSLVVWGIEVAGIYVFAAFWLVKSREIRLIERPPLPTGVERPPLPAGVQHPA